jgi:hypothetical protein
VKLLALALTLCSCSVPPTYRDADERTYRAIVPEYLEYVEKDPTLSPSQRASRRDTCASWRARLDRGAE